MLPVVNRTVSVIEVILGLENEIFLHIYNNRMTFSRTVPFSVNLRFVEVFGKVSDYDPPIKTQHEHSRIVRKVSRHYTPCSPLVNDTRFTGQCSRGCG